MNSAIYFFLPILILFWQQPGWSQDFTAYPLTLPADTPSEYLPFELDLPALYAYVQKAAEEEVVPLRLLIDGRQWDLEIWRSSLLHPAYELILTGNAKKAAFPSHPMLFLLGRIGGRPETTVALALRKDFLLGQIDDLLIEPAAPYFPFPLAPNALVGYSASASGPGPSLSCGADIKAHLGELPAQALPLAKDARAGQCYTVELAIAADYLAFQKFGDSYALENYYLGILNLVRLLYDDEFADAIGFAVRGFYISTCPTCDPWTASTNASDLLISFRDWGNAGGFGFYYDLATIWTGRVLDNKLAGLGALSAVCESRRYHVLRNYTEKTGLLRTLQAHEIGHNFSARHDPEEAPFIMAPAITDIDVWSDASRTQIGNYITQLIAQKDWCLGGCTPPVARFEPPRIIGCAPQHVQFADSSNGEVTKWQWTFPGGAPPTDTVPNPIVHYTQPGVFGARLRVSNARGESEHVEDTVAVILNYPVSTFTSDVNAAQRTVQFRFTGAGADSYAWSFGDGAQSTVSNPVHTYASGEMFTAQLIVRNACGADTSRQTISFQEAPMAAFHPRQSVGCAPLSVQFSDLSTGAITNRQWFFANGSPAESTLPDPLVVFTQPGIHGVRLLVRNVVGESELQEEEAVIVKGLPQAAFTAEPDEMERQVQFHFTGSEANAYTWSFGDGAQSTEANPSHTYGTSGEFPVQLIVRNECGADTSRQIISFAALPNAAFSASAMEACAPATIVFMDNSQGIVNTRRWSFPGGEPATSNLVSPTIRYTQPGTYTVQLEIGNAAGSDTLKKEAFIRVLPGPEAAFRISGLPGDTVLTFENNSRNAERFTWFFGDGAQSTETNPTHYYRQDGKFPVRLISENACGRDTAESTTTITRPPVADFAVLSQMGCSPRIVQFQDRSKGNVADRLWSFPGGEPASSTLPNPVVAYPRPGSYNVQLTVRNAAGENTTGIEGLIKFPAPPAARFSYSYALGDSLVQFQNQSERATEYLWDFGDGQQSTEIQPVHLYRNDGVYTVSLEVRNECRSSLMFAQVTVVTLPRASFGATPVSGCAPLRVQFENTSSDNTQSLLWQFPGGQPTIAYDENPVVHYQYPGRYTVRLKARNAAGEVVEEKKQWIFAEDKPHVDFQFEMTGPSVRFANDSEKATAYRWDFGDGQGSEEPSPTHEYEEQGTYQVQLIGINACGVDTTTKVLTVIINDTDDPRRQAAVKIFPNPSTGEFAVDLGSLAGVSSRLRLWNHLGQTIQTIDRNNQLSPVHSMQIPDAKPGLYLLEVETVNQKYYYKVLIIPR